MKHNSRNYGAPIASDVFSQLKDMKATKAQSIAYEILTYLLTYSMEQLTGFQLVKKFPPFYGARRFITAFTSARHLSLSWASSIQPMPPYPTSWRFTLILSCHLGLGLPSDLFPSGFPTKTLYTPLLSFTGYGYVFSWPHQEGKWGWETSVAATILNIRTKGRWMVNFTPRWLYPRK